MQSTRSTPSAATASSTAVSGLANEADAQPERPRVSHRATWLVAHLDVEGHAVSARLRDRLEVLLGLAHHEVAVEPRVPSSRER